MGTRLALAHDGKSYSKTEEKATCLGGDKGEADCRPPAPLPPTLNIWASWAVPLAATEIALQLLAQPPPSFLPHSFPTQMLTKLVFSSHMLAHTAGPCTANSVVS